MNEPQWKAFLAEYNRELLSYEQVVEAIPRDLLKAGWLGFAGASDEEVVEAEERLGVNLPASYRAFLKASNGWRFASLSIFDLFPAAKACWFRERNQDWIDAYTQPAVDLPLVSDQEYFEYGLGQDCCKFRTEYLQTALQVSGEGDSAVVLLNPKIATPDGEWEAWFFANWLPGAIRYRSFAEWFEHVRQSSRKQLKRLPKAKVRRYITAKKPVSSRKAQAAARAGQTTVALESLEAFAAKGDGSAAASLAELYAFLGQWDKVIQNAGRLIANPGAVYAGNVFSDMIRLLGRAGHRSGDWHGVIKVIGVAVRTNAERHYDQYHEYIRTSHDKILRNLIQYCERQGKPPHELLAIFGGCGCMDNWTREQREAWYLKAVNDADSVHPKLKKDPQAKAEYFFSLAKDVSEDEVLSLYEAHGAGFLMAWQAAEHVAPIYVRRGNADTAWAVIERSLAKWWPVDCAQVTPIILLIDEHLNTLMSPERCEIVLATPRGPEGAKNKR